MFPCLMVTDAVVYFRDVFICHSRLTETLHKKLKEALLFFFSQEFQFGTMQCSMESCSGFRGTVYFSKDQRTRFDLCVLTEAKSCTFSLFYSVTHFFLFLLLLLYICPPPSFCLLPSFSVAWSQTTEQIYRCWREASGGQMRERLPVCLPFILYG